MVQYNVTEDDLREMVRRITLAAQPLKVILFGSRARELAQSASDVDLLIIKSEPVRPRQESARLRVLLQDFSFPIDIVVVSEKFVERYRDLPGSVIYPALREGRVLYG